MTIYNLVYFEITGRNFFDFYHPISICTPTTTSDKYWLNYYKYIIYLLNEIAFFFIYVDLIWESRWNMM